MERTLPLLRDSLEDHYRHPMVVPVTLPEEYNDMEVDDFVEMDLEVRMEAIYEWLARGMRM
jgi:hypothetical protein